MKIRVVGVIAAFAAMVVVFAVIVFAVAAMQDYRENRGRSFIERAASIVGIGAFSEDDDVSRVKIEAADNDGVGELGINPTEALDMLRYLLESEVAGEMLDDLFDGEWLDGDYEYGLEDRVERLPADSLFRGGGLSGLVPSDWLGDLVERGVMTQEEADQLEWWLDDLPYSFDGLFSEFLDDRSFEFESDDGRFRFKGRWGAGDSENDSADEYEDDGDGYELRPNKGVSF